MQFIKKILVLRQITEGYSVSAKPVSAIVRTETENGVGNFYLSFLNFRAMSGGSYRFYFMDGQDRIFCYDLGTRPSSTHKTPELLPDISHDFAAGICYVSDDIPVLVAFQRSEDSVKEISDFKRAVAEKCLSDRKNRARELIQEKPLRAENTDFNDIKGASANKRPTGFDTESTDFNVTENSAEGGTETFSYGKNSENVLYDDEAVATENYFAIEEKIENKLNMIKDCDNEHVRIKDELSYKGNEKETREGESFPYRFENETFAGGGEKYSDESPYYLTVKGELEDIFEKFPEEKSLIKLFPDSRWARITYSSDKYYVVGLIKEENKEKYICYGIPSPYSRNAPTELAPYCSFIPVSVFDMNGDGYWMMFQSAVTGECIHLKDKREGK